MTTSKLEVHLNDRDAAQYFSNAAALYVLGVGFSVFAHRAPALFSAGLCFWFSIFLLCDCLRQTRVSRRLSRSKNLCLVADEKGLTHFVSWLEPEHLAWSEISAIQSVKGMQSETLYFLSKAGSKNFFRSVFFGRPKYELPVAALKDGKAAFMAALSRFPEARHLVPDAAAVSPAEVEFSKAA